MSWKYKVIFFNENIEEVTCPSCKRKGNVVRMHSRNVFERFLKKLYVKRYYCDYCTWIGIMFRRKE